MTTNYPSLLATPQDIHEPSNATNLPTKRPDRVWLVLPAYNEESTLPNLFRRISEIQAIRLCDIVVTVVDDGSVDRTAEIARQGYEGVDIRLVQHRVNMGLGQAFLTGLQTAVAQAEDDDAVVVMDADDTHDVELMGRMMDALADGGDIAIASRFVAGGNDASAPPFRRLLSRGAALVFKTALPLDRINDFTSGYRAYRVRLLREAIEHWGERLVEEQGFACMVELLLKLRHWQPVIDEVPMFLRYDRKLSASKLKLFRTLAQYFKLAVRNTLTPAPRRLVHGR